MMNFMLIQEIFLIKLHKNHHLKNENVKYLVLIASFLKELILFFKLK